MFTHYHVLTFFNINPITVDSSFISVRRLSKKQKKRIAPVRVGTKTNVLVPRELVIKPDRPL